MRYYDITITDAKSGQVIRPASLANLGLPSTFSSFVNGQSLPGALNVEINAPVFNFSVPLPGTYVRIWGISLAEISQSADLAGCGIIVRAGMQAGLPLANPAQAGVIIQGTIYQAIGNWVGTDMTLDLFILPPTGQTNSPSLNFSFNWKANTLLKDAIDSTLRTAMPSFTRVIAISDKLKMSSTQSGIYSDLAAFSHAIADLSQAQQFKGTITKSGAPYTGVKISINQKTLVVVDDTQDTTGSTATNPKEIAFRDMVGQPTWFSPTQMNLKLVMRADLSVNDYIKMPSGLASPFVLTQPGAAFPNSPSRNESSFKGTFLVISQQHFGSFRQPTADAWVTSVNATFNATNQLALNLANGVAPV